MNELWLTFTLQSDATFGRGDGVAGLLDMEVQHDDDGLPYLGGRALKGLLGEECANLLYALQLLGKAEDWQAAAAFLFGQPGSSLDDAGRMHVGDARLPQALRAAIVYGIEEGALSRTQVLDSLTAIRRQTAVDPLTGAPMQETLRSTRVILRQTQFEAHLGFDRGPDPKALALLAACVKAFRRAGASRNRGRGALTAELCDAEHKPITDTQYDLFKAGICQAQEA